MKILQAVFSVLALSIAGSAWAGPIPDGQQSAVGLNSFDLPAEQTGTFEVTFDATPLAEKIDSFTGIAAITASKAADVAAIVRFNDSGTIDARNGGAFKADQTVRYSANQAYRVRMVIDVTSRKYSTFVTPPGQAEVLLAKDYAFRSQQSAVKVLSKVVLAGFKSPDGFFNGAHRVTGFALKAVSPQ